MPNKNCDCKHSSYCKIDYNSCKITKEDREFAADMIFNRTHKEISAMQGRPNNNLIVKQKKRRLE